MELSSESLAALERLGLNENLIQAIRATKWPHYRKIEQLVKKHMRERWETNPGVVTEISDIIHRITPEDLECSDTELPVDEESERRVKRKHARALQQMDRVMQETNSTLEFEPEDIAKIAKIEAEDAERQRNRAMAEKLLAKAESDRAKASVTIDLTEDS